MLVRMYLSSASELTKVTGALMPLLTYFFGVEIEMTAKFAAIVIIYLLKSKLLSRRNYSMINERNIEAQIFQDMDANGITPRGRLDLIMDGKIHRFAVEEDRHGEKSGAYVIHFDGWPAWAIQDYRKHEKMIKGKFDPKELSNYELDEFFSQFKDTEQNRKTREQVTAQKAEDERRRKEIQQAATLRAEHEYKLCNFDSRNAIQDSVKHPYSILKHLTDCRMFDFQVRVKTQRRNGDYGQVGDLLIPLHNTETGKFQSLQLIHNFLNENGKYQKGFYYKASTTGACFPLIPFTNAKPNTLLICEGVATAASLFKAFNFEVEVIAAMNCHNIINVAEVFKRKYPKKEIIIAADNDKNRAGIKAAEASVNAGYADRIILPPEQGTDWNDYYIQKGII